MANVQNALRNPSTLQTAQVMKLWRHKPKIFFRDVMDVKLDGWQEDCVDLYMNNQRLALVASKGPGKEEPTDKEIYTPKGKVKFGDLKPNDYVFAENGKPTRILNTYPQGVKDIYKVTFDDGSSAECGLEHLWKVRGVKEKRLGTWRVASVEELLKEGIYKMQGSQKYYPWQIPLQGAANFPEKELPVHPYVLGLWLGDGTIGQSYINKNDVELEQTANLLGYKTSRIEKDGKCDRFSIFGLITELKKLGLADKNSYNRFIPEIYKIGSVEQRAMLLQGLMDSDGTVDSRSDKGSSCEYNTTSPELADDIMFLIRSLGGKCSMATRIPKLNGVEHRKDHRIRVTTSFNPFKLKRKADLWKAPSQDRYLYRTIKNIELTRRHEAMCISVEDPNRCYQTNDFIVTHNTFLLAMLGWHFFITGNMPKMAALSVTKDHLMSNLWAELLMWRSRSELLKKSSNEGFSRISLKGHEGYSFIDARSYPKQADETQMASALAGLHADFVAFLIDEAGTIPDSVLATADAALSTGDSPTKKAKLLLTANPEEPKGMVYRAYMGRSKQKWAIYSISGDPDDPKRAPRVSKEWAQEQIDTYGRDDPWVMVNVLAKYPNVSSTLLITEQEIHDAMNRTIDDSQVKMHQKRLGVDVSRGGVDSSALVMRQGLKCWPIETLPSTILGPEMAGKIGMMVEETRIERVLVDDTGGYGSSVIDSLSMFPAIDVTPIKYNASAQDRRYFNKRTEMWVRMRDWIRKGGCLPKDPKLAEDLLMPKLLFHGGIFRLEDKEQIKARLGRSPDRADALAQTFADVEQPSFFAPYDADSGDQAGRTPQERAIIEYYRRQSQGKHYSDEGQLDKYTLPNYGHKA